ncbi:MAG: alpha/beta fold hydrolase [Rhodothermales bacterium]
MPAREIHNHTIHYRESGAGPLVLLGHSSASTGGQWKSLVEILNPAHRCLAPDHIGYGKSDAYRGNPDLFTLEVDALDDLAAAHNTPFHAIGHSYGGALVSRLALRHPEKIRSLTLVEPTFFHLLRGSDNTFAYNEISQIASRTVEYTERGEVEEATRGFIDYWVGPDGFDSMKEKTRHAVTKVIGKVCDEWRAIIPAETPTAEMLAGLPCPKLLISGRQTRASARGVVDLLKEIWPDAVCWELAGAGHMLPVTHPEPVNERIVQFLAEVEGD